MPTNLICTVCGAAFSLPPSHAARVKVPSCSRKCNGIIRSRELVKHSHKGHAGWTDASRESYRQKMTGPQNPAWKGGVTYRHRHGNYVSVRYLRAPTWALPMARKDGYVMEHRLVLATWANRLLARTECVHHLDHDPLNNARTNLELCPDNRSHKLAEHGRFVEGAANRRFPEDSVLL